VTRKSDADELQAFRDAVRDVRPLGVEPRVPERRKPRPRAAFRRRDEVAVLEESITLSPAELEVEAGDEMSFRRPAVASTASRPRSTCTA
jgi:DNA-nicking Smr family endonuclease